jgi:hypothetical protein
VKVRVEEQIIVNNITLRLAAALDGLGPAYMPEDQALPAMKARRRADASTQPLSACCWRRCGIARRGICIGLE